MYLVSERKLGVW